MSVDRYQINPPIEKFLYNKTDWTKYNELSITAFSNFEVNNENPLQSYDEFIERLDTLRRDTVPKFVKANNYRCKPPAPWWSDTCEQSVIKTYEALKLYRRDPTIDNYINYKRLNAVKKKTISEHKRNGWANICNTFNRTTPVSIIWKYIKLFKRIKCNNRTYKDEFVVPLLDKLSRNGCRVIDNLESYFEINNSLQKSSFLIEPFTWSEFCTSLQSRRNTTPGLDNCPYILIKNLNQSVQKKLLANLNALWHLKKIPESWKTQCVIPLLKPDKPPEDPNSYRPISLSSCVGKLNENMLKMRLECYVEANNIIPHVQYGFRRGRSCADSFISLLSDLKYANNNNKSSVCVFLDIEGAFDNVDPGILVQVLSDIGIPGILCQWLFNFLIDRTLYIRHNNILHGPRRVSKGTMQGATLSPLLYNIYTSQILNFVNIEGVNILQFADDLVIYCTDHNVDRAVNSINNALEQLYIYYNDKLALQINPNKSKAMIFSKDFPSNGILYNNHPISVVSNHKFLGVVIDNKLCFNLHINHIITNSLKGLNIIRCLAGVTWGADPKVLSMLYKSIVRSHFDYSCLAYSNSSCVKKLDIIQNKALRIISGAMCSTPIRAMEVETKIMPLCLRRLLLIERYLLKLVSGNDNVLKKIVPFPLQCSVQQTSGGELLQGYFPVLPLIVQQMNEDFKNVIKQSKWTCYTYPYSCIIFETNIVTKNFFNNCELLSFISDNNYYTLYTDGSKSELFVRSAVYDPQCKFGQSFLLDPKCSVFTAEVYAALEALKRIAHINSFNNFLILTDSLSMVQSLTNLRFDFKKNYILYNIKKLLFSYAKKGIQVSFMWIPSHRGITGNEIVDKIARDGTNMLDVSSIVKVPLTDCYQSIDNQVNSLWVEFWKQDQEQKGKWYGTVQEKLPVAPWYNKLKMASRDFVTTINRLRFGHSTVPAHLARLGIVESSYCTFCNNSVGDIEHFIFTCECFSFDRLILVSEISDIVQNQVTVQDPSRRLSDMLKNRSYYVPLYKFIKNTVGKL
ncbi:unnamed protein product [Parnassius mnemosyne]|uniref:RNA-directed DNA polymerase from mobile element jockey n=1 Tax=Parnassius mnemosyne TaxID=213953 RepID=A0AAV1MCA4_9NEOP